MDTSKMLHLSPLDANKTAELLAQSRTLKDIADAFFEALDLSLIHSQITELVENYYDIGKVTDVYEIFGGYVNRSFGIYTEKDGKKYEYFVRKYKKEVTEKEIMFEHNLINFSIKNGLDIAAGLIPTKSGKTYVKVPEVIGEERTDWYFAIYTYLQGEDKYNWIDNVWTDAECASSAEVLATFHKASHDFDPQGLERVEPKIMELLPTLVDTFTSYKDVDCGQGNKFHEYYLKHVDNIIATIKKTTIPAEDQAKMPLNPVHCDFHPGNLKYCDFKAVGIFDFDWSKIDLRLFDIGLGLVYCCSSWIDETDGTMRMHDVEVFLKAYQKKARELGGLGALNETERHYLPEMLQAGNIYLIFWCTRSYYGDLSLNSFEYLAYLQHQVKLMYWIEEHKEELRRLAESL